MSVYLSLRVLTYTLPFMHLIPWLPSDRDTRYGLELCALALLLTLVGPIAVGIQVARLRQRLDNAASQQEWERITRQIHDRTSSFLYSLMLYLETDAEQARLEGSPVYRRIEGMIPCTFTTVESNTGTSATTCTYSGAVDAICTGDGGMLFSRIELTVPRPPPRQGQAVLEVPQHPWPARLVGAAESLVNC